MKFNSHPLDCFHASPSGSTYGVLGANAKYLPAMQKLLNKEVDMDTDVIKASLIDSADYTFSNAHDEYSGGSRDVAAAAIVAESSALGSPTITNGTFDTADFTWSSVSGDQSE